MTSGLLGVVFMKVPIFCSLIPTELILSLGHEVDYLDADRLIAGRVGEHNCVFHDNLCSYSKVLYDYLVKNQDRYDIIIVPTACDALKKLHNALMIEISGEKLYLLDLPQNKCRYAQDYFATGLERLMKRLGRSQDVDFDGAITASLQEEKNAFPKIGVMGANIPMGVIKDCLSRFGFDLYYINHCVTKSRYDPELAVILNKEGVRNYAVNFLERNSCSRTCDDKYRDDIVQTVRDEKLLGIVVNTLKFCDFQPFDFIYLKKRLGSNFPVMLIEHDLTSSFEGQIMTRLEAFLENVKKRVGGRGAVITSKRGKFFIGIDSGSHATKVVCINGDGEIISRGVAPTGTSVKKSAAYLLSKLSDLHGIKSRDISRIIATGYGRGKIEFADEAVTEISCHALGAHHMLAKAATVIDIGGQDSKAIKIDDNGGVVRFAMNDKCAAGTGRFLEVMADKLEMSLEEFAELAFNAKRSVSISSMCSVFAESEVISLIASGKSQEEIAKGIHRAIAERTIALARRIDATPPYYMAGGVARNRGLVKELKECLKSDIKVIEYPQFSGALGAALIACRGNNVC